MQPTVTPYVAKKKTIDTVRCRNCARRLDDEMVTDVDGEIWEDGQGTQWVGGEDVTVIAVPGALKYLDVELAAMGVKMKYHIDPADKDRPGRKMVRTGLDEWEKGAQEVTAS